MHAIKLEVTTKIEFECWHRPKVIAFLKIFELSRFASIRTKISIFSPCNIEEFQIDNLMEETRPEFTERDQVTIRVKSTEIATFGVIGLLGIWNKDQRNDFSIEFSRNYLKLSIDTLMEVMKTVAMEKHASSKRDKFHTTGLSWILRTFDFLKNGSKQTMIQTR